MFIKHIQPLNNSNNSLQGDCTKILFSLQNKTDAFNKKLVFSNVPVQKGDIDMFLCLQDLREEPLLTKSVIFHSKSALRKSAG